MSSSPTNRFFKRAKVPTLIDLRFYNTLLFDSVLKRHPRTDGRGLAREVFQARRFFTLTRPRSP